MTWRSVLYFIPWWEYPHSQRNGNLQVTCSDMRADWKVRKRTILIHSLNNDHLMEFILRRWRKDFENPGEPFRHLYRTSGDSARSRNTSLRFIHVCYVSLVQLDYIYWVCRRDIHISQKCWGNKWSTIFNLMMDSDFVFDPVPCGRVDHQCCCRWWDVST